MEENNLDLNKLHCKQHPLQLLTNFCLNQKCQVGLCSQCICHHTDLHMINGTLPIYKQLKDVHQMTTDKIKYYIKVLESDKDRIMTVMRSITERKHNFRNVLLQAKKDVIDLVEKIFEEMELKFEEEIKLEQKKTGLHSIFQIQSLCKKLNRQIDTLVNESQILNSFKFIDVVKNIETNVFSEVRKIHQEVMTQIKENQEFVPVLEYKKQNVSDLDVSIRRLLSLSFYFPRINLAQEKEKMVAQVNKENMMLNSQGFDSNKSWIQTTVITPIENLQNMRKSILMQKNKILEPPKHERYSNSVSNRNSTSALNIIPQFLDTNNFPFQYQRGTNGIPEYRLTGSKVFHIINRR